MGPRRKKYVCECLKVTEGDVVAAIQERRISDLKDLIAATEAGSGCTACHPALRQICERESARATSPPLRPSARPDSSQALSA